MFRYLPVWERVGTIAGSWTVIFLAAWGWLEDSPVTMSPAHFMAHTAAFVAALLLWTYERNRRQRTVALGKKYILTASQLHRAPGSLKGRAFFRGAADGIGNLMVLDGQLDKSEMRTMCGPAEDEAAVSTFEEGREEMLAVFWAAVCNSRADLAEKKAALAIRNEAECRELATKYEAQGKALATEELLEAATWHQQRAGEHAAEAAQLRAWARERFHLENK